jgi:predicted RNA binding protein YcfA (HicA-like mRNA interferase family)
MGSDEKFAVVRRLLERNGWTLVRVSGSHHIFTKPGRSLISIPVHANRVKARYVREVDKILEAERRERD